MSDEHDGFRRVVRALRLAHERSQRQRAQYRAELEDDRDVRIRELEAENERLRAALKEILADFYEGMGQDDMDPATWKMLHGAAELLGAEPA